MSTKTETTMRIPDGIVRGYVTQDFQFAAYLRTLRSPRILLLDLKPFHYERRGGQADGGVRFEFVFGAETLDGDVLDPHEVIEPLSRDYVNGKARVDPVAYNAAMRTLRAKMLSLDNRRRHHGRRRKERDDGSK